MSGAGHKRNVCGRYPLGYGSEAHNAAKIPSRFTETELAMVSLSHENVRARPAAPLIVYM